MAQVDKNTFNAQFNNSGGGYFPTNTTQAIASANMRFQALNLKDSVFFLIDDAYSGAKGLAPGINTIAGLKAIATASLTASGLYVLFRDSAASNVLRVYELVTGTDAESSPTVIRPTDYAASTNEKVWKIATVGASDAASITNTPAGNISATNVQAAINELDTEKQAALGFTPENVANKATDFTTINNTLYPTVQAVLNEILARIAGFSWKSPVTCASTGNITLSGEQTIDGVATSSSRVLVKDQSTASQNGIYVSAAGAWTRASDADTGTELHGAVVTVQQGTTNANTTWVQTADGITLGSTSISWSQLGTSVPDANATTKGIARLYPSTSLGSNTDGAPDQNAVKSYVDAAIVAAVVGLMDYRGTYDASVNAYPSAGGSGTAGAILKSDFWIVSVGGTLPTGLIVAPGDLVISKIDTPGNTQANWSLVEYNIGYTPENAANKDTDGTLAANSDTKYASQKATKTYVDAAVAVATVGSKIYLYNNFI